MATFLSSTKPLMDLHVADQFLWAKTCNDLQVDVNGVIRSLCLNGSPKKLKELEAVSDFNIFEQAPQEEQIIRSLLIGN